MIVSFEVPCVVRGRIGRNKAPQWVFTTTRVEHDIPVIHDSQAELAYAVELHGPADGYAHFWHYNGGFYRGTLVFDNDARENGWPTALATEPAGLLRDRLWHAAHDELLLSDGSGFACDVLSRVLGGTDPVDIQESLDELESWRKMMKTTEETRVDIACVHARVAHILDDLVVIRRELHIRTGQPSYAVGVRNGKATVTATTTDAHERRRAMPFSHPLVYPYERSNARIEAEPHHFAIEDRERMLQFVATAGLKAPRSIPKASRLGTAVHDACIDGLELDRICRIAVHDIALAFAAQSSLYAPAAMLRTDRAFFETFHDLREFLEERRDPEMTRDELWSLFVAFHGACLDAADKGTNVIHRPLSEFLTLAFKRFDDMPVALSLSGGGGSLPTGA